MYEGDLLPKYKLNYNFETSLLEKIFLFYQKFCLMLNTLRRGEAENSFKWLSTAQVRRFTLTNFELCMFLLYLIYNNIIIAFLSSKLTLKRFISKSCHLKINLFCHKITFFCTSFLLTSTIISAKHRWQRNVLFTSMFGFLKTLVN